MRFPSRQPAVDGLPGVSGTVRLDRRTASLVRRLRAGDVAVVDHLDLDRATAEALVECGVVAVVNASSFISGRYPNLGPELLARSGVVMVDDVGADVFTKLRDGSTVRVHDGAVIVGDTTVVTGHELGSEEIGSLMEDARSGLSTQLQSFTHNTRSSCAASRSCSCTGRVCRTPAPCSPAGRWSSWCAATTTARTCGGSALHPRAEPGAGRGGRGRRRPDRRGPPPRHRRGGRGRAGPGEHRR